MKKIITALLTLLCTISILGGCSPLQIQEAELVNTETVALTGISDIATAYGSENITFFEGGDGTIVIKEYMSENKEKYYAQVSHSGASLVIQTGDRPTVTTFKNPYS